MNAETSVKTSWLAVQRLRGHVFCLIRSKNMAAKTLHSQPTELSHLGIVLLLCGVVLLASGCRPPEKMYAIAPATLPNTDRLMKTPGFWIARHPCPDKVILTPHEIEAFNAAIQDKLKLTTDITHFPATVPGPDLARHLCGQLAKFQRRTLYTRTGGVAGKSFYDSIRDNLNLADIPASVSVRFGFVLHFADQRLLPTDDPLYAEPGDLNFDEIQNSGLDVATPVAVLLDSADREWCYVQTALSHGWVRIDRLVLCPRHEIEKFLAAPAFAVIIRPKADLYLNEKRTEYYDYVRMGVRLPIARKMTTETVAVRLPSRGPDGMFTVKTAFLNARDLHEGFRPYTPRVVIEQAFELLNAPYGWGDMYGEQDCSRFLQMIFATTGISLPRNSSEQAQVGRLIGEFPPDRPGKDKLPLLIQKGLGGITLVQVRNQSHIVLYLGHVDGRPYAIHETWGYRQRRGLFDTVRAINGVAVTDLFLGADSTKGSILDRTVRIRVLD